MRIEKIIDENQGGMVLFLGRVTNFTPEELSNFLEAQSMQYSDKYIGQEVALVVLSTMLTPLEEDTSYQLYDAKIPEVRLAEFEEYYTKHIKSNTLMMSLKLSNDQERLKRQLKNESFADDVYLKLFKMYDWGQDGVYENDDNRDMTITFVQRFFRPDGFRDPAMVYSPITLSNIARDAKTPEILDAMLTMPNHEIKQSRKEDLRPKNLRELVALNPNIAGENIRYLLSFNSDRINGFLACNNALSTEEQEHIFTKSDDTTKRMLTQNKNLDNSIFKELLSSDEETVKSLLIFQRLDEERLNIVLNAKLSEDLLAYIGENDSIELLSDKLLGINENLDYQLASNSRLSNISLEKLYSQYGDAFIVPLSSNHNISSELLAQFYEKAKGEVLFNIASNPQTSNSILDELSEQNRHELNCHLALNPSVQLKYLEQFALDSELIVIMTKNRTYLESINSAQVGMRNDDRY